jgi:hypothetical protein
VNTFARVFASDTWAAVQARVKVRAKLLLAMMYTYSAFPGIHAIKRP